MIGPRRGAAHIASSPGRWTAPPPRKTPRPRLPIRTAPRATTRSRCSFHCDGGAGFAGAARRKPKIVTSSPKSATPPPMAIHSGPRMNVAGNTYAPWSAHVAPMSRTIRPTITRTGRIRSRDPEAQRDLRLQEAGDRTALLGGVRGGPDFGGVRARHVGRDLEVDFFHRPPRVRLVEIRGRLRLDAFGRDARFPQLAGERHREAAGLRGGDEFLGVRPRRRLEPRRERVAEVPERAGVARHRSLAVLQGSPPNRACAAFHDRTSRPPIGGDS